MPRSPRRSTSTPHYPVRRLLLTLVLMLVTAGSASAFVVGDRVRAGQAVNVRNAAAGSAIGQRVIGDAGRITDGPVTAALPGGSLFIWWRVDWDTGVDGWSFENGLVLEAPVDANLVYGIDVSRWQGSINWPVVSAEGKSFAFCKATEGSDYTDPQFHANAAGGRAAGVLMGMYHFARPLNNPALTEARFFASSIRPYLLQGNLVPVLDLESGDTLGRTALSAWSRTFCQEVERLTLLRPIIYTSRNYASTYLESNLAIYPLWIAVPGFTPGSNVAGIGPWTNWAFQQYSWTGRLTGIGSGTVDTDLNAFRGTLADLAPYQIPSISQSITAATVTPVVAARGLNVMVQAGTTATHARPILMGATIFPAGTGTGGTSHAAGEGPFTLPAGTGSLTRSFALPATLAPGSYDLWLNLYVDVDGNGLINSGDASLTTVFKKFNALTVTATPTIATWAALQGLSGPDAGSSADPDADGSDNLTEYAFGTLPGAASSRPATALALEPDGSLAFSFERPAGRPDLTWIIQQTDPNGLWADLATAAGDAPFTAPGITQTGTNPVRIKMNLTPGTASRQFFRLKIVLSP